MEIGLTRCRRRRQPLRASAQGLSGLLQPLQSGAVRADQADLTTRQTGKGVVGQQRLEQALGQPFGRQQMQQLAAWAQLRVEHTP
ncbi:hypothetical protein [Bordetella holmesii]|uniref:hypothetical protein n=1 Tax=Bordetella holmesii TaxID=35814 RepID=UPI0002B9BCA5|nr:hypothetical protein [Bordetella holmesii]AMD45600.1 hypothetical protein H558_08880 [Bordetella holmesii H558]AMD50574.1 hypothetical protein F783_009210 [Bordetella holmesii F627]AOB34485.1 hypothetical protein BBB42_02635 [Bordetella holmesii]AUL18502.1 hypothetical protein BTL46_02660 [Bordetella holmesii]AUL21817.1 hypothetical protein BTL48_02670 [Bordetella holmesii]